MHTPDQPPPAGTVELADGVCVAEADLRFTFTRSRGPGGQAVNKLSTRAELRVAVSAIQGLGDAAAVRLRRLARRRLTAEDEIVIQADTHRSQVANRRACVERLADLVERARKEPVPRKRTRPTRASVERRLQEKRRRADVKRRRKEPPAE